MADDGKNEQEHGPGNQAQGGNCGQGNGDQGGGNPGPGGGDPGPGGGGNPGPGGDDDHGHDQKITVLVNEKPVVFADPQQTGKSIKRAAIKQGVQIQPDFVLSIERGGGKTELIGDDQPIEVRDGDRFLAIPNDDNS